MKQAGLTLVELLATLVFISIVAGAMLSLFMSATSQQQQARELELARSWLMAELALQRIDPTIGACQSASPFRANNITCIVQSHQEFHVFETVRIALVDTAAQPARTVASVVGVAGGL